MARLHRRLSILLLLALLAGLLPQRSSLAGSTNGPAGTAPDEHTAAAPQLTGTVAPSPSPTPTLPLLSPSPLSTVPPPSSTPLPPPATTFPSPTPTPSVAGTASLPPLLTGSPTPLATPPLTPPPTYTIGVPTPPPTLTAPPTTNVVDQALHAAAEATLAQIQALPALTGTISGTLVSGLTGGRITSADGALTLGLPPGAIALTDTINVQLTPASFTPGDPRATRDGQPLAYTYELTATQGITGERVTHFAQDAMLVWTVDPAVLTAAGVVGFPLHVYTYDETRGTWVEVHSYWKAETHQLIITTPHFSLYTVGTGFDVVNNYVPSVNSFSMNLQSGTAAIQYPINLPPGPGGFAPKVTLSYDSGNVDHMDAQQQGTSNVGWGWSLSMSYVAATEQHFNAGYHPWTASIVSDGVNGDLVKGTDTDPTTGLPVWHTAQESFSKILYHAGVNGNRETDWWEAWDKDGTHYVFDYQALDADLFHPVGESHWTTTRWLLHTVTDVHNNVITYDYYYEGAGGDLPTTPILGARTRAVYPRQITYGAGTGHDLVQVLFRVDTRTIAVPDVSSQDQASGIYQTHRITGIDVKQRQQNQSGTPTMIRSYDFAQSMRILLTANGTAYPHLTLDAITPHGTTSATQLPSTTFTYHLSGGGTTTEPLDWGHLYAVNNGYGGEVRYEYDAAGGDVDSSYRRVRTKWVRDGLGETAPHNVSYVYTYRGGTTNTEYRSDEAAPTLASPLHKPGTQFRGFAWVQEQDPSLQATQHYYSQDDLFKAQEWRVQTGKTISYTETMNNAPSSNANWSVTGDVTASTDPAPPSSGIWVLGAPVGTTTPTIPTILRQFGVQDGSDIAVRLRIRGTTDSDAQFGGTWKIENANGNGEYWGLQVYSWRPDRDSHYALHTRVVWGVRNGGVLVEGSRDLDWTSPADQPNLKRPRRGPDNLPTDQWYRLQFHTSPDGRFALELYSDDPLAGDYIQIKSSDPAENNGPIPLFPTGQNWRFKQQVTLNTNRAYLALADDYTESRTVYSQADSVYSDGPLTVGAAQKTSDWHVGSNNCDGMNLHFRALTENWTATYGSWSLQPGQVKRTKTTYRYDPTYGNQNRVIEYGDLDVAGDERSLHSRYAINTTRWIVDKLAWTNTFRGIVDENRWGTDFIAQMLYFYDNQTVYEYIPPAGNGDLTMVQHSGIKDGVGSGGVSIQHFHYDSYGNQDWVQDPRGNQTTTTYDPYYHAFPVAVTYPNGRSETTGYDFTRDVPTTSTDMNGTVTGREYDEFGRPSKTWVVGFGSATSPNEQYSFSDTNHLSVAPPFFISYARTLDPSTGPNASTWQTRWFDGRGRALQDVSPRDTGAGGGGSIVINTLYNDNGLAATAIMPYGVAAGTQYAYTTPDLNKPKVSKTYDGIGRPTLETNPDNTQVIHNYDLLGWVVTVDESGHQKWQHTDMRGRLDQVMEYDPVDQPVPVYTSYAYDLLDNLLQVTRDSTGGPAISTMTYDGLSRKRTMSDPDMGNWEYDYDDAGNLTRQRDALYLAGGHDDHQVIFEYDTMNRIVRKYYGLAHYPNTPDVKYYYDNDKGDADITHSWGHLRLAEVTAAGQGAKANAHWYQYDPRGLTVQEDITTAYSSRIYTIYSSYDNAGRLKTVTYPAPGSNPEQVQVHYNGQGPGLPNGLTSTISGNPAPVYAAGYNERDQLVTLQQGSGPTYGNLLTTNFTYDDTTTKRGWLSGVTVLTNAGDYLLALNMSYAPNGNVNTVAQTLNGGSSNPSFTNTFTYDAFDRLRSFTTNNTTIFTGESYTYDRLGRMQTRTVGGTPYTYSYDPNHKDAPSFYQNKEYQYDAAGNQIYRNGGGSTQNRTFDPENRLSGITTGTPGGTTTSAFIYDANGQRLIQSVTTGGSTVRTLTIGSLYEEVLTAAGCQDVTWASATNVAANGSTLQKTGGTASWEDAGTVSSQTLASGDGYASVIADTTDAYRMFGLSHGDSGPSYTDIDYALELAAGGVLKIHESGVARGVFGSYAIGDVLKVAVENGQVNYYRNSTLLYTSQLTPSYPLLLDSSIYTPGSQLQSASLCTGTANPPTAYITYYQLGGKAVGLRRVDQAGNNGQYRLVGDHLGSTTLLVDTSSTPQVAQRTYYKPYGEVAQSYGSTLTSVGYTGQRLDSDSGLLYYGTRFYDANLSHFVSADTIAPDPINPQSRDRYSYVLNNPIKYTDPSGHCADPDRNSPEYQDGETCSHAQHQLHKYGINVYNMDDWSLAQLLEMLDGIARLMTAMEWTTIDEFREAMGIDTKGEIWLYLNVDGKGPGYGGAYYSKGADYATNPNRKTRNIVIEDTEKEFNLEDPHDLGSTFVHELAHAWDDASDNARSTEMATATGSYSKDGRYYAGGYAASDYGGSGPSSIPHNQREDWAEAVTGTAYPERARYNVVWDEDRGGRHRQIGMDRTRRQYVHDQAAFVTARAKK